MVNSELATMNAEIIKESLQTTKVRKDSPEKYTKASFTIPYSQLPTTH